MCDKYIVYTNMCLTSGKCSLTQDELSYLFGTRSDVYAQLNPQWLEQFVSRCRMSYRKQLARRPTLAMTEDMYTVQTDEGSLTTYDARGHVMRIEHFIDPLPCKKLSESALVTLRDTLVVFSDIAFRTQRNRQANV